MPQIIENNSILKFTYEEEKNNKIAFWDVLLTRTNQTVDTSVFTKPTASGDY